MPVSDEVKKILDGGAWASAGGALTQDPSAATPPVTRADGYGAAYSSTLVPEQETIQGRWNEFDSAIIDIFTAGVPFYDAMIDYPVSAIVNEGGTLSRALVANGPTAGNAIAPSADTGGTTWARVSGTTNAPGRPAQPTATSPEPGTLDVSWNCPLDGGSVITSFVFQYREAGGSWPGTERTVTVPRAVLTGLTNGQAYEFRVMAVNAIGDSAWSATGTGTPTASAPVGGSALALRADAGDGEADLSWLEPDDGGDSITSYEVQWRTSGQTFNSTRQRTVTGGATTDTVPSLMNGTEYFFRVRAVNGQGESTWSNEASATPAPSGTSGEEVTAVGSGSFVWPWGASVGFVVLEGGGGGSGARNMSNVPADDGRASGNTANNGGGGGGGVDTTMTVGGVTYTAEGGGGGGEGRATHGSGSSGGDGGDGGNNRGHINNNQSNTRAADGGSGNATNGAGGINAGESTTPGNLPFNPGRGGNGELLLVRLTGLSIGDSISYTVGAGGQAGSTTFDPNASGGGSDGHITFYPLY